VRAIQKEKKTGAQSNPVIIVVLIACLKDPTRKNVIVSERTTYIAACSERRYDPAKKRENTHEKSKIGERKKESEWSRTRGGVFGHRSLATKMCLGGRERNSWGKS